MYLKQADLFWGMSQSFIQSLTANANKQVFQQGDVIFKAGDPADRFLVLIKGKVNLELEGSGDRVYTSDRVGETIGWSALIGRKTYSATAICEQETHVLMFDKEHVTRLLSNDAEDALLFFKQLARALGERLLQAYQIIG